jgi:hypothetical protein
MRLIFCAVLFGCCTISFAGDSLSDSYKNGIGWDNGLSYRHLIGKNTWLGLAVSGSITSTPGDANDSEIDKDTLNDSISSSYISKSTTDQTNYTIKISGIILGKIAEYQIFGLNYFFQPSYSYTWSKDSGFGPNASYCYNYDNHAQTLAAAAGIAPTIALLRSLITIKKNNTPKTTVDYPVSIHFFQQETTFI